MITFYIDTRVGDDTHGDGSAARPFKTLTHTLPLLEPGNEIAINDALIGNNDDFIHNEPTTVELIGLRDINIRFLKGLGKSSTSVVWKPSTVNSRCASLYMENCSGIKIDGAVFMSTSPLVTHTSAVKIVNCRDITVSNCRIHSGWTVDNSCNIGGELFSASNSTVIFTHCGFNQLNNSYTDHLDLIGVDGSGEYGLYSIYAKNLTSNNGMFRAVHVGPETRKVTIDGLLAYNLQSDLIDHAIGLDIESDESQVEFLLNAGQFSKVDIGVRVSNIPNGKVSKRIKHCTFYKTSKAVVADDSFLEVYSCAIHSTPTFTHEYPPGHVLTFNTYGVFAKNYSNVSVLNTILTGLNTALYAEEHSRITAEYLVWNNCLDLKSQVLNSEINAVQYVRRVDPKYVSIDFSVYGQFSLSDESPCIDSGKRYGDPFLGLAPDIGALERSRSLRIDDLPALVARSSRYIDKVPLTNIDIEGMIVQGLDTYDPEVQAGREGSAIKDIAVKPLTGLLSPYTTELEYIRDGLSFANIDRLSEDAADALASNLFVTRRTGDIASGIVRLYFEAPKATVIPAETEFNGTNLKFYSRQEVTVSAEEMSLNYDNGMYYIDTIAEAQIQGTQYNIPARSITSATTPLPEGVVAILNPYPFVGGENKETNLALKERTATAITVRDLVTKKGIIYVLPDVYKFITEVCPIGFRDPEMLRDEILGYHIGGKVDIYIKTAVLAEDSKVIAVAPRVIKLNSAEFGNVPIIQVTRLELLDPLTEDSLEIDIPLNKWTLLVNNPATRFSVLEDNQIELHPDYIGATIRIHYKWVPEIEALQDWVEESDNRVVCADLLVKHFTPCFIDFSIAYYAPQEYPEMATMIKLLVERVKSTKPLQESDIIDLCYELGVTYIVTPFTMRAEYHPVTGIVEVWESDTEISINRTGHLIPNNITCRYLGVDPKDNS